MSDETSHLVKGSLLAKIGLSVRGIVVIVLIVGIVAMSMLKTPIPQEVYWLASSAIGYYFGQQHQKNTP